jgi:hypothetical protein
MYFNYLPQLYFELQLPKIYTTQTTVNAILCTTPSSALGHHVTPTTKAKPTDFNPMLQHGKYAVSGVQNVMTHLAYDHINDSFFKYSYTKTEIISSMKGHPDQYPETQNVKSSHSCVAAHSSPVIYVFSKQFCSDISALNPVPRNSSTHTVLPNKSPSSIKDPATLPTVSGMKARAMLHNIMSVTHTRTINVKPDTKPQNGAFCKQ